MPAISIIVPVYNASTTLSKCVHSIISQTFTSWELWMVDDGSTDNSSLLCQQFQIKDSRVKVLSQQHLGVSVARNLGLDHINGDYVCFIDADDFVEPTFLEQLYKCRNYDIVVCGYYSDIISANGVLQKQTAYKPVFIDCPVETNRPILFPLFVSGMMNFCWNKLFKSKIIKTFRIRFENIPINEDYLFVLNYLEHVRSFRSIPLPFYHWEHVQGKDSAVSFVSDSLLTYYLLAHRLTAAFFNNSEIAGQIMYYSYYWVILKYFERIPDKKKRTADLNAMMHQTLVCEAFQYHRPVSKGEGVMVFLLRHHYYSLFYSLHLWLTRKKN